MVQQVVLTSYRITELVLRSVEFHILPMSVFPPGSSYLPKNKSDRWIGYSKFSPRWECV